MRGRRVLVALGLLVALALAGLVVLKETVLGEEALKGMLLGRIEASTALKAEAQGLRVFLLKGIVLEGLRLKGPGGQRFMELQRLKLRYSLLALLRGQVLITRAELVRPRLWLLRDRQGRLNLPRAKGAPPAEQRGGPPLALLIKDIALKDASVYFSDQTGAVPALRVRFDGRAELGLAREGLRYLARLRLKDIEAQLPQGLRGSGEVQIEPSRATFLIDLEVGANALSLKGVLKDYLGRNPRLQAHLRAERLDLQSLALPRAGKDKRAAKRAAPGPAEAGLTASGTVQLREAFLKNTLRLKDIEAHYRYQKGLLYIKLQMGFSTLGLLHGEGDLRGSLVLNPLKPAETLSGTLRLRARGGRLRESSFSQALVVLTGLEALRAPVLESTEASLELQDGRGRLEASLKGRHFSLGLEGSVELLGALDLKGTLRLSPTLSTGLSQALPLSRLLQDEAGHTLLALLIRGTPRSPSVRLDAERLGRKGIWEFFKGIFGR
jgi:hypothetical protein